MSADKPCGDRDLLLHGLADGELDAANAMAVEDHLHNCETCAAAYAAIRKHKQLLSGKTGRLAAPAALRDRIRSEFSQAGAKPPAAPPAPGRSASAWRGPKLLTAFSAIALAASLTLFISAGLRKPDIDGQLAAAHVRSLLASHLMDIQSSDQHTVKPWYLGKLDFAPPVVDLTSSGFPLIGGRLDFISGRVVPALVYKRHAHVINLFVWPSDGPKAVTASIDGYNIVSWDARGFSFAAVSDLNAAELHDFRNALSNAAAS